MKLLRRAVVAGMMFAVMASNGQASEFRLMGPRALSMGGASVARPAPAYAAYYNPAALGLDDRSAIDVTVGLSTRDTGISEHLDPLTGYDWDAATDNPEGAEAAAIIAELRRIKSTDSLMLMPSGAAGMRFGSLASGIYPSAQMVIYAHLDTVHLNATSPLEDPNSFAFNSSELYVQGLGLVEVPLAYGHSFKMRDGGKMSVGGSLKFIQGATYDVRQGVLMTSGSDQIQDTLENADKVSAGFGMDLGVLYRTAGDRLSLGLLARNLNSPKFKTVTGDKFKEDAQVRAGVAYDISKHFVCAVDLDVTANKTLVSGYKSRQLSAGIGYEGDYVALRGGIMKNVEVGSSPVSFCLGATLGGESLHLDVAGSISGSWQDYDEYSFPVEGGITLALGGGW